MKKVVLEFDDDEVELLQQQLNQIQDQIKNMQSLCSYGEKLKNQYFQRPF